MIVSLLIWSLGQKRMMSAPRNLLPSSSSVVARKFPAMQADSEMRILNGRPLQNHGLPIELYHPIFDKFRTDANEMTLEISPEDYKDVARLCVKAAEIYEDKDTRSDEMHPELEKLLAAKLTKRKANGSRGAHADRVITFDLQETQAFLAVMNVKNEIGTGHCDPAVQAASTYASYMAQPDVSLPIALTNFVR